MHSLSETTQEYGLERKKSYTHSVRSDSAG